MPRWISRKPGHHADITVALPSFMTRSCRLLATGYAALIQNSENGHTIPSKNGLDISSFAPIMADIALAAITINSACIFRIAGEGIRQRFAHKLVGTDYYDLVAPARRSSAIEAMEMVVSTPCAFRVELLQHYDNGEERRAEACVFPLLSDEPDIDGFALFANSEIDRPRSPAAARPILSGFQVVRRDLIDIGFGLDQNFKDMVPKDPQLFHTSP